MDINAYRSAYFTDPPPEPHYRFSGSFGVTLFLEDFATAVAYYERVLGPPAYVQGEGTRGWRIGDGWLTFLKGSKGGPRNVEFTLELETAEEAEELQRAFIAAGGQGPAPSDQLMYRPVRSCPVIDPFGTEIMIICPLETSAAQVQALATRTEGEITYRTSKDIRPGAILALFLRNDWREWFTLDDAKDLLSRALFVASAWHGRRVVGIATLFGDGRFYTRIDTLLVDEEYRRQGIGTALVELVMREVIELEPHYCEHDIHEDWLVQFYGRFGFEAFDGPWLVHKPTGDHLSAYVERRRQTLKK
jgi:GNAT superfamily N-acetyltransferase